MFKLISFNELNKNFSFKTLFSPYENKEFYNIDNIIFLDELKKDNFWVGDNTKDYRTSTSMQEQNQLLFITNFRYDKISFLIGIFPDTTTGIISKVMISKTKELISPLSRYINLLCDSTMLLRNTDLVYYEHDRRCPVYFEYKNELLNPSDSRFKFTFDLLSDITYGYANEVANNGEEIPEEQLFEDIENNIPIINWKLKSSNAHIGDFLIKASSNDDELDTINKIGFYLWED